MFPPVFETLSASAAVTAIFGSDPVRIFPFGQAPPSVATPYCVWQIVSGEPENYLATMPDMDNYSIQFDVYGQAGSVRDAVLALRDAVYPAALVVAMRGEATDTETGLIRHSFDVEWFVKA